ncbi:MAG TPA: efflux RND transporter permease subunit, partial [Oscillospiraceae bacterium]|nr:efflux RND transporter permease subunit [Oscillospiraceae bacterium]
YISQVLAANNVMLPAGDVQNGSGSLTVRTDGEFSSVDDVKNAVIPLTTGGTVRLGEVADVYMTHSDMTSVTKINGDNCVLLSVNKQSGINTVKAARATIAQMEEIAAEDSSIQYTVVLDQSDYINIAVNNAMRNIILGVLFAAVVLFLFLHDFGATLVVAVSMPVCIVVVFLIMQVFDITLNMMSLGGIAMGVGMIVDNSIVVLENIFRFRADGKGRLESCVEGSAEVSLSIVASTLTTVVVFLPIGLSSGISGQLFRDFALTIAALLLASLFIALTLVPLLCYYLLDRGRNTALERLLASGEKKRRGARLMERYTGLLDYFIHRRGRAVVISIVLVVVFLVPVFSAGMELIPAMDQGMVVISVSMPTGSELEETAAISDRILNTAQETVPELTSIYYQATSTSADMRMNLVPLSQRDRSSEEIGNALRESFKDIAGCEISIAASDFTSYFTGDAISVDVTGNDYDELTRISQEIADKIAALPDAVDVTTSASEQVPQVSVKLKQENAARYGLTAAAVGQAVRSELTGSTATTLKVGGEEISVSVRGDKLSSLSLDSLKSVAIPVSTGGSVPLSLVADVDVEMGPQSINRTDQTRSVTITGSTISGDSAEIAKQIEKILDEYDMPQGYFAEIGGTRENMTESFTTLGQALLIAVGLVYFVLSSQFESFLMPVIIMLIVPISFAGGLFGLPVTGNKFSMVAIIGIIMLAGVVVNSSIILVDYTNTRRRRGEDKNTALLNACPRRVRPVLMTTLTTILGLLPMALGLGEGSELMAPMAIVMIFGMVVSTVVTLLFTPVYYSLIDSLSGRLHGPRKRPLEQEQKL